MKITSVALITQNAQMRALIHDLDKVVHTDTSVLLTGETGVGKEIFAEYIHRSSDRFDQPFVKISLASLPEELLASELFGHERGAFTSATGEKKGLFEIAHNGSIFLDDLDDVPIDIQTKLLRVLENGEIMRVGGVRAIQVDVRLIAATKVNLKKLVDEGKFRSDLYFRIHVFPVRIPPLRERKDDIPLLITHFIKMFAPDQEITMDDEVLNILMAYEWPGNVRELKNIIHRVVLLAGHDIHLSDLPVDLLHPATLRGLGDECVKCFEDRDMTHDEVMACMERRLLSHALSKASGNKTKAAEALGLSPSTYRDKLTKYGINGEGTPFGLNHPNG